MEEKNELMEGLTEGAVTDICENIDTSTSNLGMVLGIGAIALIGIGIAGYAVIKKRRANKVKLDVVSEQEIENNDNEEIDEE